jgi:hypothetical protein
MQQQIPFEDDKQKNGKGKSNNNSNNNSRSPSGMTNERTATATAKANAGVLRFAQNDTDFVVGVSKVGNDRVLAELKILCGDVDEAEEEEDCEEVEHPVLAAAASGG